MKKTSPFVFAIILSSVYVLLLFLLTYMPISKQKTVWKGYQIIAVPTETNVAEIANLLIKSGFSGPITADSVKQRFENAIYFDEQSNLLTGKEEYTKWFINESFGTQYLYLPIENTSQFKLHRILSKKTPMFFMESVSDFSLFQLIFVGIIMLTVIIFTKNRIIFFFSSLPFLLYANFTKSILTLSSASLAIYSVIYWIEAISSDLVIVKEHFKKRILKNYGLIVVPILAFLLSAFAGIHNILLFTIAMIISFIAIYFNMYLKKLYDESKSKGRLHNKITPYAMNPITLDLFWDTQKMLIISVAVTSIVLIGSLSLYLYSKKEWNTDKYELYAPSPIALYNVGFSEESYSYFSKKQDYFLPDLISYINDSWFYKALLYEDYRTLHNQIKIGDTIQWDNFIVSQNGQLIPQNNISLRFDSNYIENILKSVTNTSIEKMLYHQESFCNVGYKKIIDSRQYISFVQLIIICLTAFFPILVVLQRLKK